jgi:hypothetical protein
MDVLTVGGKEYVKASVIARDLGYTSDYVGQLCRARKVNAKLVGRSWYVDSSSIQSHKGTRYRSTQAKSLKELRQNIGNVSQKSVLEAPANFYTHNKAENKVRYESDEAELIPAVSKVKLPVELADAQRVSIREKDAHYHFVTPELPKIKFQGTLLVSNYEGEKKVATEKEKSDSPHTRHIHPKISKQELSKKNQNIAISAIHTSTFTTKLAESKEEKIHKDEPLTPAVGQEHVQIGAVEEDEHVSVSAWALCAGAVCGVLVVLAAFALEAQVFVVGEMVVTSYSFAIENLNLAASAYQSIESLEGVMYLISFSTDLIFF